MIAIGELKPVLTTLVLPPTSLLLLIGLGLLLAARKKAAGLLLAFAAATMLWLLSCPAVAAWLALNLLPQYPPLSIATLRASPVQAIVVLGAGVYPQAPEYGEPQAGDGAAARLRYGVWLARQTGLPVAFAGGVGWGATDTQALTEAEVARRAALQDYGLNLRWMDDRSRDTAENAQFLKALMQKDRVQRIALVTHAWHMPRSVRAFERAGFTVLPAPTRFILSGSGGVHEWLPSSEALVNTRQVFRECLGLLVQRFT